MDDILSDEESITPGFHGCYLLASKNPANPMGTYIGYTVNPERRISQHNKGKDYGGAKKTSNNGPWLMTLIVHGFPSRTAALGFEWAWQNPDKSRRLRHIFPKKEKKYPWWLKVMWTMLRTGPWDRLPLKVQWLLPSWSADPPAGLSPPVHMMIIYGLIKPTPPVPYANDPKNGYLCYFCRDLVLGSHSGFLKCPRMTCLKLFHVLCLAKHILKNSDEMLPVSGHCPECKILMLWGDLMARIKDN